VSSYSVYFLALPRTLSAGYFRSLISNFRSAALFPDAKYKAITSGEKMTAKHKYGKLFDFKPYSTLFFAPNHLPHTRDTTYAFFRRTEIIKFNVQFDGDKCDTKLEGKLRKELPGILNFALAGLKRLQKNGDFTQGRVV
jgi:putative DNA primase/helicase